MKSQKEKRILSIVSHKIKNVGYEIQLASANNQVMLVSEQNLILIS